MTAAGKKRAALSFLLFIALTEGISAADIFQFNAPPGGVYLNSSFEQTTTERITITVEHEGAAITEWYIAADEGTSSSYLPRELTFDGNTMDYQLYKSSLLSGYIMMAPPESLSIQNVISTADFNSEAVVMEQQSFDLYFHIESGQFIPEGTYSDTITLYLYTGDYSDAVVDTAVDSVSITVYGRMAELLDIYCIREPGIRFMDLTTSQTDKLIATVNERSNSSTGYTVSITSKNLAEDTSGSLEPFFLHSSSAGSLTYSLKYDGTSVGPWSSGTAPLTDSDSLTDPDSLPIPGWVSKLLSISYAGSMNLPAGDYEDILTLTISAK